MKMTPHFYSLFMYCKMYVLLRMQTEVRKVWKQLYTHSFPMSFTRQTTSLLFGSLLLLCAINASRRVTTAGGSGNKTALTASQCHSRVSRVLPPLESWASHACLTFLCDKIYMHTQKCFQRSENAPGALSGCRKFQNFLGEHAPRPPQMARCRAPPHVIFKTLILPPPLKIFLDESLHSHEK